MSLSSEYKYEAYCFRVVIVPGLVLMCMYRLRELIKKNSAPNWIGLVMFGLRAVLGFLNYVFIIGLFVVQCLCCVCCQASRPDARFSFWWAPWAEENDPERARNDSRAFDEQLRASQERSQAFAGNDHERSGNDCERARNDRERSGNHHEPSGGISESPAEYDHEPNNSVEDRRPDTETVQASQTSEANQSREYSVVEIAPIRIVEVRLWTQIFIPILVIHLWTQMFIPILIIVIHLWTRMFIPILIIVIHLNSNAQRCPHGMNSHVNAYERTVCQNEPRDGRGKRQPPGTDITASPLQ